MIRVPRSLAILMMGIGGLFGMRTPPEPTVVAQTQPAPGRDGLLLPPPDADDERDAPRTVVFPKR